MRTIIIGDINGCFKELVLLLEKVQFDQGRDLLISLGDMIDRGPRSFQVFEYLRSLKSRMGEACILIRGNHEQMMIDYGSGCDCALEMWEADGGSDTRKDFLAHHASIEEAARWLKENCWKYGFILRYPTDKTEETGIIFEPWHYRYVGEKAAKEIMEQGICLEEYLDETGGGR